MSQITLSVLRCPDSVAPGQRQASGGEISLGRGAECDWPLADPERVLSKKHCVLEFFGGGWQLRDLSTNGTFLNHESQPIGRDQMRLLSDGDRLRLGAYEIEVRIAEAATQPGGWGGPAQSFGRDPFGPASQAGDPFGQPPPSQGFGDAPLPGFGAPGGGPMGGSSMGGGLLPDNFDPFGGPSGQDQPPMPDHAPAIAESFMVPPSLPAGKAMIPDDWDFELTPKPAAPASPLPPAAPAYQPPPTAPAYQPPPAAPAYQPPPAVPLDPFLEDGDQPMPARAPVGPSPVSPSPVSPSPVSPSPVGPSPVSPPPVAPPRAMPPVSAAAPPQPAPPGQGLAALLAGAGLPPNLPVQDPDAALRAAGAILHAAIAGIRDLLVARADVKREFRIEQTMLRAANNNPLKYSHNTEVALAALLDPRTPALGALKETLDDLTAHQVATLAATQAAARALLDRLAPAGIEAEDPGGGLLPGAREKRLWEAYKRRHALLAEQFDDDFDSAFGKAFARAYEQASARKDDR